MKKMCRCFWILAMFIFVLIEVSCSFAQPFKVAVMPFHINAVSDMSFLQDGIQDMLSSRLYWKDKVDVMDKETVNSALSSVKGFSGKSLALLIGGKLGVRFVVYGSLTMIGESASIDAKIVDVEGATEPLHLFKQTKSINQVIPQINAFATDINNRVFKRSVATSLPNVTSSVSTNSSDQHSINSGALQVGSGLSKDFWTGPSFNYSILGMDIGDVNNDGIEEIVWISDRQVYIFQYKNRTLIPIGTAGFNRVNSYISVDIGDINQNGIPEIFLTGLNATEDKVSSIVLEFDGSAFRKIVKGSSWMYRVVKSPNSSPVLLGQKAGVKRGQGIFTNPVHKMKALGGDYISDSVVLMGNRANVLGVTLENLGNDGSNNSVLAFDRNDYIRIYKNSRSSSWKAVEKLGGNMSRFQIKSSDPTEKIPKTEYFPMRIRTFVQGDREKGQTALVCAANHDSTGNLLEGFRKFSRTKIKALVWDSLGLSTVWESRVMSGRISDFFVADIDNDNVPELVLSLVKKDRGQLVSTKGQSMIMVFDLAVPLK